MLVPGWLIALLVAFAAVAMIFFTIIVCKTSVQSGGFSMPPTITPSDIIYQEWYASGHSQKNFLTRFGGARNCLRLVVTKDLLWVTSWFPFSMITAFYDLEHVIPRDRIISIHHSWAFLFPSVVVTFLISDGKNRSLRLWPWRQSEFVRSLGGETSSAEPAAAPDGGA